MQRWMLCQQRPRASSSRRRQRSLQQRRQQGKSGGIAGITAGTRESAPPTLWLHATRKAVGLWHVWEHSA